MERGEVMNVEIVITEVNPCYESFEELLDNLDPFVYRSDSKPCWMHEKEGA